MGLRSVPDGAAVSSPPLTIPSALPWSVLLASKVQLPAGASPTMTVAHDLTHRGSPSHHAGNALALEDRFEVLKEIGDGSFGSVVLARVRSAGANVARRGSVVGRTPDETLCESPLTA